MALVARVAYDGRAFHGFQIQAGRAVRTVQGELERVFTAVLGGPGRIRGAGRTDAGVHARGQVVSWDGPCPIPEEHLLPVLNRRLPPDLRLEAVARVADPHWDPRRHATAKAYAYRVWTGAERCPLEWAGRVWTPETPLDLAAMSRLARRFEGTHDFRAFRKEGSSARTTRRRVLVCRFEPEEPGRLWTLWIVADGFLYHMVRMIMGALVFVGGGGPEAAVLAALERPAQKFARLAPAQGLTLEWIAFDRDPFAVAARGGPAAGGE
ncbi:tRNA pseudouridine synthase A [Candidatus Hydrogenisulfobacillus filiaventi]|uniref:tRNA pseudouridine synthase A n=1 Tax=Candidatus Hydrogenisulfobacillus filiaventi TaxID=2707344 RepID=A0A6F8ZJG0_9FIRM|nr:tRNA pseudouridine(38-40) synthase TruA [Bacillota bacterium]CAB1129918.1 tRNA pseudouridine synthase A [Candidatus Hydrogenisulfobacillus filiaventi]